MHRAVLVPFTVSLLVIGSLHLEAGEETSPISLHDRIDQICSNTAFGPVAVTTDDSTFLKRVYLDLIGRIPTISETRSFLSDERPDKRVLLVDDLLNRPDFARHMAIVFDVMLMERRGGKHVTTDDFRNYLEESFKTNKSYLTLVREILGADGTPEKIRPASAFYLERDVEPTLLTRELGRTFFGVDLQCAQCHDHPNIADYHQQDFYGLQAFVIRASLFRPDDKQPGLIMESAEGEANFKSVFTDREGLTGPRVIGGEEVVEAKLTPSQQYQVAPAKNVRHIPTHSRLASLSENTTGQPTEAFNRNIANRLWRQMFGRGLVEPVDLHHSGNPPVNPELLSAISTGFVELNYDVKSFLREIALSQTYQRSAQLPETTESIAELESRIKTLQETADTQLAQSYEADKLVDQAIETLDVAVAEVKPLRDSIAAANKTASEALAARDKAAVQVEARKKEISEKQSQQALVADAAAKAKIASETLKDDAELTAAADTIQKKADALAAAIIPLQESEKTEIAALEAAEAHLHQTESAEQTAIAAALPGEEKVRNLRDKLIELRFAAAANRNQSQLAKRDVAMLQAMFDQETATQKIAALTKRIPELTTMQADTERTIGMLATAVSDHQTQLDAALAESTRLRTRIESAEQARISHRDTALVLVNSLAQVSLTEQSSTMSQQLAAAKVQLTSSLQTIESTTADLDQRLSQWKSGLEVNEVAAAAQRTAIENTTQQLTASQSTLAQIDRELQEAHLQWEVHQKAAAANREAVINFATQRSNIAGIIPLTPEQLGWSLLAATGQADRQRAAESAKYAQEHPLSEEDQKNPEKLAEQERAIDAATKTALNGVVNRLVQMFGGGVGQPQHEFFATADQALFFSNGGELRGWLSPSGGNLTDRLNKLEDAQAIAEELYLSILCRLPIQVEVEEVKDYLTRRTDAKSQAVQELAWALFTSAEFRFRN